MLPMFAKGYFRAFFRVCTEEVGSEETNCSYIRISYMSISQDCVFHLLTRIAYLRGGISAPCGYEHMQCSINIVTVSGFWEPMSCGKSAV